MYDDILVPTDGSDCARRAVEEAVRLATAFDAALHTFYVVDTELSGAEGGGAVVFDELEAEGERIVRDVVERAEDAGVDTIEASVATGVPYRSILDYCEEYDVDLVVMGTHGRTGLERTLVGSVTEKVVRTSDVPVLTVSLPSE
ncbi:universal stress protein [Haloplanus sp. GCM10025708]|uniref:universal stress protein n=1 Tax=Haloferacaceae TaxID=1644056 RepID=UPI003615B6C3